MKKYCTITYWVVTGRIDSRSIVNYEEKIVKVDVLDDKRTKLHTYTYLII